MDAIRDLRRFRREHNLTQQDLAAFLGVSQRTISRWERGEDRPSGEAEARLNLLIGERGADALPAVYEAIRDAVVPIALVDASGAVLIASRSYPTPPPAAPAEDRKAPLVPTVLVVEDDEAVLRATRSVLKRWRFLSLGACDGETAVRMVAEEGVEPDAAIIDFLLPGPLDGVDTARALRDAIPDLPVLLISGDATAEHLNKIAASGFPLIPKPVDPLQIRLTLTSLLRLGV